MEMVLQIFLLAAGFTMLIKGETLTEQLMEQRLTRIMRPMRWTAFRRMRRRTE